MNIPCYRVKGAQSRRKSIGHPLYDGTAIPQRRDRPYKKMPAWLGYAQQVLQRVKLKPLVVAFRPEVLHPLAIVGARLFNEVEK